MECSSEHNESGVSPIYVRRHHSGRSPQSCPTDQCDRLALQRICRSINVVYNKQTKLCILSFTNGSRIVGSCSCIVPCFLHVCWKTHKIQNWLLIKCSPKAAETNWAFEKVLHIIKLTGHLVWFILRPMRLNTESLHSHAPTLAARGELHFNELLILVCAPVIITDLMNIYVSCLKFRDVRKRRGMLWRS